MPVPDPSGEALVRVIKSGICNTDLEIVRGYAGFRGTIGHEFVGVVESAEGVPHLVGRRVVGEINAGCGVCALCAAGDPRHCSSRTVLGIVGRQGAHAEFLTLPSRNLLEVPDCVSDDEAVFTEPLAAALGIMEQVEIKPSTRAAVIGDGKLGLLCALALRLRSSDVTIVGKHTDKMSVAADGGVSPVLRSDAGDLARSFDVVVEASGSETGFADALDLVRPRGKIVLKSTFHGKPTWEAWRIVVDEISVVGSRCGRFSDALEVLAGKRIDVTRLISDRFGLEDGVAAVGRAGERGVLKVLIGM
jgi:threonine dehydrogenase-like Zn-dependent dehydrogenase